MVSLQTIQAKCPGAIALSNFEIEITARGFSLRLTLPHADVVPAGSARWGSAQQRFQAGRVEQSSKWDDEGGPATWEANFEGWVEAWLGCLNGGPIPGP
jgi:hypothetical protein